LKQNFIGNLGESNVIDEIGVLSMASGLLMEVKIRSFLKWCFEEYGEQMKFKHNDTIFNVINLDELGYVTGKNLNGIKISLHPRKVITRLPNKAFRFFRDNWLDVS